MPVIYQAPKFPKLSRREIEKALHKACRESYKLDERQFSNLLRTIEMFYYSRKIKSAMFTKAMKNRDK